MAKCTCGRSTSGDCKNWHNLSNEDYERVRMEEEIRKTDERNRQIQESAPQLLQE